MQISKHCFHIFSLVFIGYNDTRIQGLEFKAFKELIIILWRGNDALELIKTYTVCKLNS